MLPIGSFYYSAQKSLRFYPGILYNNVHEKRNLRVVCSGHGCFCCCRNHPAIHSCREKSKIIFCNRLGLDLELAHEERAIIGEHHHKKWAPRISTGNGAMAWCGVPFCCHGFKFQQFQINIFTGDWIRIWV